MFCLFLIDYTITIANDFLTVKVKCNNLFGHIFNLESVGFAFM